MVFTCTILAQPNSFVECVDENNNPYPEVIINDSAFNNPSDCINDGSISVSATVASGSLEYRLNDGEWGVENNFDSLWAGDYTVYVRIDSIDCSTKLISNTLVPRIMPVVLDTQVVQLTDWCREDATIEIFDVQHR